MIYSAWTQHQAHPPVPSPSDIAYLGFYVSVAAAVVWLARRDTGSFPRALWLDGAIGAAGAAAALAAGLSLLRSGAQGDSAAVIVGAAYTVADLLLVAMIAGLLTVRGVRGGSIWVWLAAGMATFCAADVVYAVRVDAGIYAVGPWLHVLWMTGITCIAVAIWSPRRSRGIGTARSRTMLAIPMLATLTSVGILALFSCGGNPVVMSLATLTLLLAVARTFVSFRQVQRLSDARRQAVTDDLTGLGNRRSLFEHGTQRLERADAADRLALILIDLDNFKEINDTFGHPAGDELLREIARRLTARASEHDLLVRLGGDEFAILRTLAAADDGRQIATGILDRITEPLRHRRCAPVRGRERGRRRARRRRPHRRPAATRRCRDVRRQGRPLPRGHLRPGARPPQPAAARDDPGPRRRAQSSTSSCCTISRRSRSRPAPPSAPRRSCAGSTRPAACSTRTRSSRSSSRAA